LVSIADDLDDAGQTGNSLHAFNWLWTPERNITETDPGVDTQVFAVGDDSLKSRQVAMNISENGDQHYGASLPSRE
jgi:hypothetical protein